jgi:hypothetical protein
MKKDYLNILISKAIIVVIFLLIQGCLGPSLTDGEKLIYDEVLSDLVNNIDTWGEMTNNGNYYVMSKNGIKIEYKEKHTYIHYKDKYIHLWGDNGYLDDIVDALETKIEETDRKTLQNVQSDLNKTLNKDEVIDKVSSDVDEQYYAF